MNEFQLIQKYFRKASVARSDVLLGVGDDAAIIQAPANTELAITTDTLISGVHFPVTTAAEDIGYKSVAVNFSDLAAMGANPAWVTLALTLPAVDEAWLAKFCSGFYELLEKYQCQLIGGDTTRGSLSITLQAIGLVKKNNVLRRSGAQAGDLIYVSGNLGDAGAGLLVAENKISLPESVRNALLNKLNRPVPRLELGQVLGGIASSAIDISDGLAGDLAHILIMSGAGATIHLQDLPMSAVLRQHVAPEKAWQFALHAGDDYELCFTIPAEKQAELENKIKDLPCSCACIGRIEKKSGLRLRQMDGSLVDINNSTGGYRHF